MFSNRICEGFIYDDILKIPPEKIYDLPAQGAQIQPTSSRNSPFSVKKNNLLATRCHPRIFRSAKGHPKVHEYPF